ncbi:hypothetical protein GobsT_27920 [Gemmata obscuriglobus]|uniref:hypothetical protein n=1 Tax=Gemmata obscuriglobus TaxID=114 RepID=UPI0011CCFC74|nr:hypothetical protein [Gemmata obscuriglobus]QEG28023.1 hypothetical protein GobsT_27920 [Gemmata obscuriglobus]VTS05572.1 unnamed protein product [Gemmata obscuriglobus UQM 2246]
MNDRPRWVALALLALLPGACGLHRSAVLGIDTQADAQRFRNAPAEPFAERRTDVSVGLDEAKKPIPENAFSGFIDNSFNSWTLSHRVDMPIAAKR